MTIYRGMVKGNVVVLPPEAQLADGSIVEVRLAQPAPEAVAEDIADQQVQAALVAAGLLKAVQPLGARAVVVGRPLLHISGPPVSETIIAERR